MARFQFLGLTPRPGLVKQYGPVLKIRCHCKDGSTKEFEAPRPSGFRPGDVIEVSDSRAVRHLEADTRFERLV